MSGSNERPNPSKGFRLVTNDGKEKFLSFPMRLTQPEDLFRIQPEPEPPVLPPAPVAQDAGQPPSEPPQAPPAAMEPEPEPEKNVELDANAQEVRQARIGRLEKEYAELLSSLYWVQTELKELKGGQ